MPWMECSVMDERVRFVGRLLDGEAMSDVCRSFGISRKTGYKIFNRYRDDGLEALTDRSRRPVRYANQLPDPIERMIVTAKKDKPHWGARKIREVLVRKLAGDVRIPARSTVHAVLDRHGLVARARQRRQGCKAEGTQLSQALWPNDLWCADFKGEFKLGTGRYCYPLTVTDQASRFILHAKPSNRQRNSRLSKLLRICSGSAACRSPSGAIAWMRWGAKDHVPARDGGCLSEYNPPGTPLKMGSHVRCYVTSRNRDLWLPAETANTRTK
jgi:transposase InsO family protein